MKYLKVNELREIFLSFFEKKGHTRFNSFSLIPQDDNSLLLINSGMAPLKKYFLGEKKCKGNKATDCQKCIRTPDIERVGITSRHGTFFEMLGNFSFGDYFKLEAINLAWEFATKVIEIPKEKIYVTVYEDDDETYNIWINNIGVDKEHISKLGKDDNFWEIGIGPCGPCTELYYDRGEKYGCGKKDCKVGCDCDRYVEFWNLVFSQYISDGKGNYKEMESKNIDTGMGLERLACIMQGVDNLFEIDTVKNILQAVCKVSNQLYNENEKKDIAIRVITDHIRSSVFLISDKVMPSNEGRGYILRRLIRRAIRYSRKLEIYSPFLYNLAEVVIEENKEAYPELQANMAHIKATLKSEEEKFLKTIDKGLELVEKILEELKQNNKKEFPGDIAFKLYDTYGFPLESIEEAAIEAGFTVDREKFEELMTHQREMARKARGQIESQAWEAENKEIFSSCPKSEFVGYDNLEITTKILWLCKKNIVCDEVNKGDLCWLVIEKTPFYATSGGQINDIGEIISKNGKFKVLNNQKINDKIVATAEVIYGAIKRDEEVLAKVDIANRKATCKNHSACHILQKALQEILGEHVMQAGSYVNAKRLRFDFSHFKALSALELKAIEQKVNEIIFAELPVVINEMKLEDAKKTEAMALFSEKYGDKVRVCNIGDYSKEFCGGTHVSNTAQINIFKIVSETSVSAGIRRIEAITGFNVFEKIVETNGLFDRMKNLLKANSVNEIEQKLSNLILEAKSFKEIISKLNRQKLDLLVTDLLESLKKVGKLKLITGVIDDLAPDELQTICNIIEKKEKSILIVLVGKSKKNLLVVSISSDIIGEELNANKIVKELCKILGGNGGGKRERAMGNLLKCDKLENLTYKIVEKILSNDTNS